jgi:hypothetical protein
MPFTTAQVNAMTGLCRWKASTIAQTDNTNVTTWVGTGDTARTLTAAGTPKYRTSTINGKPGVTMAKGTFDLFSIGGGGLALADFTILAVYKMLAVNSDCNFLGHSVDNLQIRLKGTNLLSMFNGNDDTSGGAGFDSTALGTAMNDAGGDICTFRRKNRLLEWWEAGRARGHNQWSAGLTTQTFNAVAGLSGNAFYDGTLCELLVFTRYISFTEFANVLDYFKAEYGINPAITPTTLVHPLRPAPVLYGVFQYQAAAAASVAGMPINITNAWNFNGSDIATVAAFNAAIASKIPAGSVGYASGDAETVSPCLPVAATDYNGAQWSSTLREGFAGDQAYLKSLSDTMTSSRPGVSFGWYWHPYIDTANYVNSTGTALLTSYAEHAANTDFFDGYAYGSLASQAYAGTHNLMALILRCRNMQPELYDKNMTATQDMLNLWFRANVQLCWDLQDYWGDGTLREVMPFMWLQEVAGAVGASITGFAAATFTFATKTLTVSGGEAGAFNNFKITGDPLLDRVHITSGTGGTVTEGIYPVASKTDGNNLILATTAGFTQNATAVHGSSAGVFQSRDRLTKLFTALRLSGADGAFVGGDANPAFYTAHEWQMFLEGGLRPALANSGLGGLAGLAHVMYQEQAMQFLKDREQRRRAKEAALMPG